MKVGRYAGVSPLEVATWPVDWILAVAAVMSAEAFADHERARQQQGQQ